MNFTPKIDVGRVLGGVLTIAVLGLIGWGTHVAFTPAPLSQTHDSVAIHEPFQANNFVPAQPAVLVLMPGFQSTSPTYYQPVSSWYKSKHWWKRNAPIVGGAGGGALVGGLVGGGTGAVIGGAVGGGGGYLYKRHRDHHYHHNYYYH
jgi:hypothetical protein